MGYLQETAFGLQWVEDKWDSLDPHAKLERAYATLNNNINTTNMSTKQMGVFEEMEYKEFMESKALKEISAKVKEARGVAELFANVARKIGDLRYTVDSDVNMVEVYANDKEIKAMNETVESLTAKLEVFEDKKVIEAVNTLATIFGISASVKKLDKKDVAKSLGL